MSTAIPITILILAFLALSTIVASLFFIRKLKRRTDAYTLELANLLQDYKNTAQALKKSQAQLNAIVNQLPCDLWVFDNLGNCVLQNIQASKRWGPQLNKHIKQLNLPITLQAEFINGQESAMKGRPLEKEIGLPADWSDETLPIQEANSPSDTSSFLYKTAPVQSKQKIFGSIAISLDVTELKATKAQLEQETSFSRMFLDNLPALFYLFNREGELLRWNADFERVSGYNSQQLDNIHAETLFSSADLKRISDRAKLLESSKFAAIEAQLLTRGGRSIPFYFTGAMIEFEGHPCILGCGINISERKKVQQALSLSEERFRLAFNSAPIGMALVSTDGRFIQTNHQLRRILGYRKEEFRSLRLNQLEIDNKPALSNFNDSSLYSKVYQTEKKLAHKKGHTVWVQFSSVLIDDSGNNSQYYVIQIADITERRELVSKLHRLAFHDTLTGLPNRKLFTEFLSKALGKAKRESNRLIALIFIDLDRFKRVNDSLGHLAGDELLKSVAKRLKQQLRPGDTVARFAGDEFVVLLDSIEKSQEAVDLAHRLQSALDKPIMIGEHPLICKASMGICVQPASYTSAETLLRDADIAMYRAKERGRGQAVVFSDEMHRQAKAELDIENRIREAIADHSFKIAYQPIISMTTGRIVAVEALSRLPSTVNPDKLIEPSVFLPVAEDAGLLEAHDRWVLKESIQQVSKWQSLLPNNGITLGLNVNLSSKHLLAPDFLEFLSEQLQASNAQPHSVGIEITESVLLDDDHRTLKTLKALRKKAVNIHLDDFGTGYSALSYLYKFPIDSLKIDKSFIQRMLKSEKHLAIVRSIILLAKTQNIRVTAEGIETQAQFDKLASIGCSYGQGYYLSKPMPVDDIESLLLDNRCWLERSYIDRFEPA